MQCREATSVTWPTVSPRPKPSPSPSPTSGIQCPDGEYLVTANEDGTGEPLEYESQNVCCPLEDYSCSATCTWYNTDTGDFGFEERRDKVWGGTIPGGCT